MPKMGYRGQSQTRAGNGSPLFKISKKVKRMPGGRPSDYTHETADKICEQLSLGKSLNRITKETGMPSIATVYSWMTKHPEFLKKYEEAKANQIDTLADEMQDIADNTDNNTESVMRDRLRVDTRKWIAERMKPKKYGIKGEIDLNATIVKMEKIVISNKEVEFDIGTPQVIGFASEAIEDN